MAVRMQRGSNVLNPDYYKLKSGRQVRDVIRELELNWAAGTAVAYVARAGKKVPTLEGTIEDYEKAIETLKDEVSAMRTELRSQAITAGKRRAKRRRTKQEGVADTEKTTVPEGPQNETE